MGQADFKSKGIKSSETFEKDSEPARLGREEEQQEPGKGPGN